MPQWIWPAATTIITAVFSAGAVYGTVKKTQNGAQETLNRIETKVDNVNEKVSKNTADIAENKNQIENQQSICNERSKALERIEDKI